MIKERYYTDLKMSELVCEHNHQAKDRDFLRIFGKKLSEGRKLK